MGELLPNFSKTKSKGMMSMSNGGEYHIATSKQGKKIFKLFSIPTGTGFRSFELYAYCNYTTVKAICLLHGDSPSFNCKINLLGKNGDEVFYLKNLNGDVYLEVDTSTTMLEVRVKPIHALSSTQIALNVANDVDLSNAKPLGEL